MTIETVYAIIGSLVASWSAAAFLYTQLGAVRARVEALDERTKAHHQRITKLETR